MQENKNIVGKIIISTLIIVAVAALGSVFVNLGIDWFNGLIKPLEWIPNFLIPVVWTVIYLTFAIVNFIWIKNGTIPKQTVVLMIINAVLNVLWCLLFFTFNLLFIGNIAIIFNLIAGFFLWASIYKSNKIYSYILLIYPVWLSIATTLNLALWILN